jgi:hypothetical protein
MGNYVLNLWNGSDYSPLPVPNGLYFRLLEGPYSNLISFRQDENQHAMVFRMSPLPFSGDGTISHRNCVGDSIKTTTTAVSL